MNTRMRLRPLQWMAVLISLSFVVVTGAPATATAQQAVLYEIVENMDTVKFVTENRRASHWTAQGTAERGSPFCPEALPLPVSLRSCTITAFGYDNIEFAALEAGEQIVGTVWANVVALANLDNAVDAPEVALFSGQITGQLSIFPGETLPPVMPDLRGKKSQLGPAVALIYIRDGRFFPDGPPTIRTSPPEILPEPATASALFESTFRLPFNVGKAGKPEKPERGKNAYYLGDDGSLIKVDKQDEFALGFPLLRGEVFFTGP